MKSSWVQKGMTKFTGKNIDCFYVIPIGIQVINNKPIAGFISINLFKF